MYTDEEIKIVIDSRFIRDSFTRPRPLLVSDQRVMRLDFGNCFFILNIFGNLSVRVFLYFMKSSSCDLRKFCYLISGHALHKRFCKNKKTSIHWPAPGTKSASRSAAKPLANRT